MNATVPYAPPVPATSEHHLARVVSVSDVHHTGRIDVRLYSYDGLEGQDSRIPARVCVPCAGAQRGTFFIPDVDDEVVVAFLNGDPRQAVVIGALWNGRNLPRERLPGDAVDRWTIVGRRGTRIAIIEENGGGRIRLSVGSQDADIAFCDIDRDGGGSIELSAGGSSLRIDSQGVRIESGGDVSIRASSTSVTSATVTVDAADSTFQGLVKSSVAVQTPAVIGSSYTPGAGNVW